MNKYKFLTFVRLLILAAAFFCMGSVDGLAQTGTDLQPSQRDSNAIIERIQRRITQADRQAAADNQTAARAAAALKSRQGKQGKLAAPLTVLKSGVGAMSSSMSMSMSMPNAAMPHYFGPYPNWAYSPLLRKFVDSLPGLGADANNNLGQYIPVAISDTNSYPGSDYYEIGLVQYTEKMHSDLPPTTLRGYVQLNDPCNPATRDANGTIIAWPQPHYLGPIIIAQKDRPVRVKFTNLLPTGADGDLFLPVDTTEMGAGMGPTQMLDANGMPMLDANGMPMMEMYTENRGTLHLHGGRTVWISDGTPHQWTTPAGEMTAYPKGVSAKNVPDMPDPGPGSMTFFYSNQQSARLMFYHDHAYGITRLNVYAGEAAGYLITDAAEQNLIASGVIPAEQIPLIIQDKTFVNANTIGMTDPTWNWGSMPGMAMTGDLWFPHVYMPNQNPYDLSGANPFGRWDYGPWFWPPWPVIYGEVNNPYYDPNNAPWEPPTVPGLPDVSMTMEAFHDTPVINGTAYPYIDVQPKAYRFRILNAANDRFWNLLLLQADPNISVGTAGLTEVKMVPFYPGTWPAGWGSPDARDGGVPDPCLLGPAIIQIGNEGGFLPAPVIWPNIPVDYEYDRRNIVVLNVKEHNLFLGCAERADVIIDFSAFAGKTLILYNDSPAPVPAADPRLDYYTGDEDSTETGGTATTLPGFGPNIRTIMQIRVADANPAPAFDMNALNAAFASTATTQGVFAKSQDPIIVPQDGYNSAYNATFPANTTAYERIQSLSLTFKPLDLNQPNKLSATPLTIMNHPKAIAEEFEDTYGRMSGFLGVEVPFTNGQNQTTIFYGYIDPATENLNDCMTPMSPVAGDGTQIWKVTHNGVDTHPVHFHLFDVQLINRVGWDGAVRPPEKNELGWKETVRMNPLEDCIVALRPVAPRQPFGIPDSNRPLDPTMPLGDLMGFKNVDPNGNPITVVNEMTNFGWEYVWHCHILSHEEMDMMRPMVFNVARSLATAPVLTAVYSGTQVSLNWTDATLPGNPSTWGNPANEIGFRIERATGAGAFATIATALANATTAYIDTTIASGTAYRYRVVAFNAAGDSMSNIAAFTAPGAPTSVTAFAGTSQATVSFTAPASNGGSPITLYTVTSIPGNITATGTSSPITVTGLSNSGVYAFTVKATNAIGTGPASSLSNVVRPMAAPTNLRATTISTNFVILGWNDNSNNEQGFYIERSNNGGATWTRIAQTAANTATYRNNGLTTKTTYLYRVQAFNTNGLSAYTNTLTVTTK